MERMKNYNSLSSQAAHSFELSYEMTIAGYKSSVKYVFLKWRPAKYLL
jgi:hypothetical protein